MYYKSKGQILNRLNKVTQFDSIDPEGPVESKTAEMPVFLVLQAIAQAQGLNPGTDCVITDYVVGGDGISLKYLKGKFSRTKVVPETVGNLFAGDDSGAAVDFED
jgi:hypothetical protein